ALFSMEHFAYESAIKEIKGRLSIINLIETYISLKKSGKSYVGLCPFHDEKTPSFNVNEEKGVFHCFGCGAGGDIFGFMMRYNNLTFSEALKELARRADIKIEENCLPSQKKSKKDTFFKLNTLVLRFYHNLLIESKEGRGAREYLEKRHIPAEAVSEFKLGYAPGGWDTLVNFLNSKKVPLRIAEEIGLVIQKRNKDGYYDRFRERIIFPIQDVEGRVVGFGGRTLVKEEPKYMNSPESEVYHKRSILYGLDKSRDYIKRKGSAVLVEGYMDLLTLYFAGIKNVIATLGTSLSQDHAKLLRRYTDRIVVVFDGDESGMKASVRVLEVFLKEGLFPYMVILPEGDDPDSFISKGNSDEFSRLTEDAVSLISFFIDIVKKDFQSGKISRSSAVQTIMDILTKIKDPIERSHYVKRTAENFGIREADLLSSVKFKERAKEETKHERRKTPETQEKIILKVLLKFPEHAVFFRENNLVEFIPEGEIRKVIEDIVFEGFQDASSLLMRFRDSYIQEILSEAVLFSQDIPDRATAIKILKECVRKLELKGLEEKLGILRLKIDLAKQEKDENLENNLIREYRDLKEREKKIKGDMHG
ncbi:MAG TPA: DNA primase, partial [Thermodesulfobacteriota bacterium]|nr:DNA primase [Thermodesulfobacteriota bacterium]